MLSLECMNTLFIISNVNAVDIFRIGWVVFGGNGTHFEVSVKIKRRFYPL
jgi:hypothetical protein